MEGDYNMNKVELNWIRLYKNAPLETRKASKKHWIEVLQRAIRDDNEFLRNAAQLRLAQMTIIEYSEGEE